MNLGKLDVNAPDRWSNTPLHYAADKGHVKVVDALMACEGIDVSAGGSLGTPLHAAAAAGVDMHRAARALSTCPHAMRDHVAVVRSLCSSNDLIVRSLTRQKL